MTMKSLSRITAVLLLFFPYKSTAEILRYTDEAGVGHFVDDVSLVPEKYRDQLRNSKPLSDLNISNPVVPRTESRPTISKKSEPEERIQEKRVEIYVTSWCPQCRNLVAALDAKKVRYEKFDIEKDKTAEAEYNSLGGQGVPLTRVGSRVVRGNSPDAILRILYED